LHEDRRELINNTKHWYLVTDSARSTCGDNRIVYVPLPLTKQQCFRTQINTLCNAEFSRAGTFTELPSVSTLMIFCTRVHV